MNLKNYRIPAVIFFSIAFWALFCLPEQPSFYLFSQTEQNYEISINAYVTENKIPQNKDFSVFVVLRWTGQSDKYEIMEPSVGECQNCEIVGNSVSDKVEAGVTNINIKEFVYILRPKELGMAYFGKVSLQYANIKTKEVHTLNTQAVEIKIVSPVYDRKPAILLVILIMLGVAIIATGLYFLYQKSLEIKKKKEEEQKVTQQKVVTPEEKYLELLRQKENLMAEDYKKLYSELTNLAKAYLGEKFNIKTKGLDTESLIKCLDGISAQSELIAMVTELFEISNSVKFAELKPANSEIKKFYEIAKKIIGGIHDI